jgi:5'-phosphate synthase pdxT subunit
MVGRRIGILALQGGFLAHQESLQRIGVETTQVRNVEELKSVDALVFPGGESTTMSHLLRTSQLFYPIRNRLQEGMPAFGTCAGMILLASNVIDGRDDQLSFAAIDIDVQRNAYGRQVDSFETDISIDGLSTSFHAAFIRAPQVVRSGSVVSVLSKFKGSPVLVREGSVMVASFHPELAVDDRVHELFLEMM